MGAGSGARPASFRFNCVPTPDRRAAGTNKRSQASISILFSRQKKPELPQDQAQVVAGTTQQDIQLVALCPFQVIAVQQPIGLQVADNRLNRLAALERPFQSLGFDAALLPGDIHRTRRFIMPPIPLVHKRLINTRPGQAPHLCQGFLQGVAVIGTARQGHAPHHEVALVGGGNTRLHPEFITFSHLALTDTFHLRGMQTVQLIFILFLLPQQSLG